MAIYNNNFKYHEDEVNKRDITKEEIDFLLKLQKEMNTQDHVAQADPRFWVIKGSKKIYRVDEADNYELYDSDSCDIVASSMSETIDYIEENLLKDIRDQTGIEYKLSLHKNLLMREEILVEWTEDGEYQYEYLENNDDILTWLENHGYTEFELISYKIVPKIYENTFFLTHKAAEEHLKNNSHHYSEDAHAYAMTSWRNPEATILWKILQEVDWNKLLH